MAANPGRRGFLLVKHAQLFNAWSITERCTKQSIKQVTEATCVGGHVAADLAAALRAQVQRHTEAPLRQVAVQRLQHAARVAHQDAAHLVDEQKQLNTGCLSCMSTRHLAQVSASDLRLMYGTLRSSKGRASFTTQPTHSLVETRVDELETSRALMLQQPVHLP